MNSSSERVRELAKKGALDEAAAAKLLDALGKPAPKRSWVVTLLDPIELLGTAPGAIASLVIAAGAIAIAVALGVRFDGLVDLHPGRPTVAVACIDAVAAVLAPTLVYYLTARVLSREVRIADFFVTVGVARWPTVLCGIALALMLPPLAPGQLPAKSAGLYAFAALAIAALAIHITSLYRGFATSSGLKGARRIGGFVAATALAELASKVVVLLAT